HYFALGSSTVPLYEPSSVGGRFSVGAEIVFF
ncbi:MAG: hypothetical protein K0S65_5694, partial [Labilithrix sp.]|nr:hypothetical protein [Labilithrix sp.]